MSGTFGQSSGTVQTQGTSAPWSGVQPYLLDAFQKAQNQYNTNSQPGSLVSQAQGAVGNMVGTGLDPSQNPNFKASVGDALGQAGSAFAGQYGGAAGTNLGNTGYQEGLARNLGTVATNAYANQYNTNAQQQLQASALAPGLSAQPLQSYIQALSGQGGAQTTNQTPYFSNPLASLLGGAVGLGALGNSGIASGLGNIGSGIGNLFGLGNSGINAGMTAANSGSAYSGLDPNAAAYSPGGSLDPYAELYGGGLFNGGSGAAAAAPAAGGTVGIGAGGADLTGAANAGSAFADVGAGAAGVGLAGLSAFAFPAMFALNDMMDNGSGERNAGIASYEAANGPGSYAKLNYERSTGTGRFAPGGIYYQDTSGGGANGYGSNAG